MAFQSIAPETIRTGGLRCIAYNDGQNAVGTFSGRVIRSWIAPVIDFTDINPGGVADYFSIRCFGYINPRFSETYTLYITTDDGVRLWISANNFRGYLINSWVDQSPTTHSGQVAFTANTWYPIIIEHYERAGGERLLLEWQSPSQARQVVPSDRLGYDTQLGFG